MKLQDVLADGTRVVAISPLEWDALATATEIAFEDEDPIPTGMRAVAASLYAEFHVSPMTLPKGWEETETGGGCTALHKDGNGAEMFITTCLDPRAPSRLSEQSVLGIYRTGDNANGEDLLTITGTAERLLAVGDRFAFITEGVPFFAFPACGSFLGVLKNVLLYCPMMADSMPALEGTGREGARGYDIGEVENSEGIDFDDVNSIFGTSFSHMQFSGR